MIHYNSANKTLSIAKVAEMVGTAEATLCNCFRAFGGNKSSRLLDHLIESSEDSLSFDPKDWKKEGVPVSEVFYIAEFYSTKAGKFCTDEAKHLMSSCDSNRNKFCQQIEDAVLDSIIKCLKGFEENPFSVADKIIDGITPNTSLGEVCKNDIISDEVGDAAKA